MFFPVNIAKLLITAIFIEHLRWLLLINFFFLLIHFRSMLSCYTPLIHKKLMYSGGIERKQFT